MRLIKMTCPSCGAKLDIDGEKREFVCEYCHTTTLLDDEVIRVEHRIVDENADKKLEVFGNVAKGIGTIAIIPFILFGVVFLVIVGIIIFNIVSFNNKSEETSSQINEVINSQYTEFEIRNFNSDFELYSGTQATIFVETILDIVVTNNKKEKEHIISVIYNGKSTTDVNEIVVIKKSLEEWGEYEVSLDYDENGFVNKVTIS